MSASSSYYSAASVKPGATTNPNPPYPNDLASNDTQPDDNSVLDDNTAANSPPLSSNLSIQADSDSDAPDSGRDENDALDDKVRALTAGVSPSSLSRQRYYDIQPTWPCKIDQTKISAYACWHPEQKITQMKLDIHWAKQHAFFKLHTRINLKQASQHRRRNAYIFIYPERIDKLVYTAETASEHLLAPIALTFYLNRPSTLILPKTRFGFAQKAEGTIGSLRNLVQQSSFTIYAELPNWKLSHGWLQRFCEDITEHKLSTITSLANLTNLYQDSNSEAEVIEGDSLLENVTHEQDAANSGLPPYQEGVPSVPLTRPAKRKRSDTSFGTEQSFRGTVPRKTLPAYQESDSSSSLKRPTKRPKFEENSAIEKSLQDTIAVQTFIGNASDAKFVADGRKLEEMLSTFFCALEEKLSTHKREVEDKLSAHKREVEDKLSAHKREVEDQLNELTDTLLHTIEEEISDQVGDVRDDILDKVSLASISIPGFL